jgi:hypothetical protein
VISFPIHDYFSEGLSRVDKPSTRSDQLQRIERKQDQGIDRYFTALVGVPELTG